MTNLFQFFQGPAAYIAAVLQLLLGEVNQVSERLNLPTQRPIYENRIIESFVGMPQYGITGLIKTTNYSYTFSDNCLHTVTKIDNNYQKHYRMTGYTNNNTCLSSNAAFVLATQWLAQVSVDVPKMVKTYPTEISQRWQYKSANLKGEQNQTTDERILLPIFDLKWRDTNRIEYQSGSIKITLNGETRELLHLEISDYAFMQNAPLVLANKDALLKDWYAAQTNAFLKEKSKTRMRGPWWGPPVVLSTNDASGWMANFYGGSNVSETMRRPDKVQAFIVSTPESDRDPSSPSGFPILKGPIPVDSAVATDLAELVLDVNSYDWRNMPFGPKYVARISFTRDSKTVDVFISIGNESIMVYPPGKMLVGLSSRPSKAKIQGIIRKLFPNEPIIKQPLRP